MSRWIFDYITSTNYLNIRTLGLVICTIFLLLAGYHLLSDGYYMYECYDILCEVPAEVEIAGQGLSLILVSNNTETSISAIPIMYYGEKLLLGKDEYDFNTRVHLTVGFLSIIFLTGLILWREEENGK